MESIQDELEARVLCAAGSQTRIVRDVIVGAMGVQNAQRFFKPGTCLITPGDREDLLLAAAATVPGDQGETLAGIVLTEGMEPSASVLKVLKKMPFPVLLAEKDSYEVASIVHEMLVKTRPNDIEKIDLIRGMIGKHVDVKRILSRL